MTFRLICQLKKNDAQANGGEQRVVARIEIVDVRDPGRRCRHRIDAV